MITKIKGTFDQKAYTWPLQHDGPRLVPKEGVPANKKKLHDIYNLTLKVT